MAGTELSMGAKPEGGTPLARRIDEFLAPCPDSGLETVWAFVFGIAAPALVLTLDVQWWLPGLGTIELLPYRPYSSSTAWAAMAAFAAWYPFRARIGGWQLLPAGAFAVAALMAAGIGILLLPFALMFSIVGIGLLGLVPLFTALVFARAARRAWRGLRPALSPVTGSALTACAATGFAVCGLGAGALTSALERRATEEIIGASAERSLRAEAALEVLRWIPGIPLDGLRSAARAETESVPGGKERAREAFERITGRPPEELVD